MVHFIRSSFRKTIFRAFLVFFSLQLVIGLTFFAKNFFAGQESLLATMLEQQAQEYMLRMAKQPGYQHLNNASLSVYTSVQQLPADMSNLAELPAGLHNFDIVSYFGSGQEGERQVLIVDNASYPDVELDHSERFYFISQVPEPDELLWMLDKTLGFIVSYLLIAGLVSMVFIWQLNKLLLQPLSRLVAQVDNWDFAAKPSELSKEFEQGDLGILAHSLDDLSLRLAEFVSRERQITRNISHELRTPLTVIRSTLDLMILRSHTDAIEHANINKLMRACKELEAIIHALLWLGRNEWPQEGAVNATDETQKVMQELAESSNMADVVFQRDIDEDIWLECPAILYRIVLGNLIRNAVGHGSQASIQLTLNNQFLTVANAIGKVIEDKDSNLSEQNFGLGLDIVKQICERMGWQFYMYQQQDKVKATVRF